MLSSFARGLENLPRFVRLFHMDVVWLVNQRFYRQLLLSPCTTDFLIKPMPLHVLRVYLYLVRDMVDELLFPLTHYSMFVVIMTLNIQLLIKSVHAKFEVVELEQQFLKVELPLEHCRHIPDLVNLLSHSRLPLTTFHIVEEIPHQSDDRVLKEEEYAQLVEESKVRISHLVLRLERLSHL